MPTDDSTPLLREWDPIFDDEDLQHFSSVDQTLLARVHKSSLITYGLKALALLTPYFIFRLFFATAAYPEPNSEGKSLEIDSPQSTMYCAIIAFTLFNYFTGSEYLEKKEKEYKDKKKENSLTPESMRHKKRSILHQLGRVIPVVSVYGGAVSAVEQLNANKHNRLVIHSLGFYLPSPLPELAGAYSFFLTNMKFWDEFSDFKVTLYPRIRKECLDDFHPIYDLNDESLQSLFDGTRSAFENISSRNQWRFLGFSQRLLNSDTLKSEIQNYFRAHDAIHPMAKKNLSNIIITLLLCLSLHKMGERYHPSKMRQNTTLILCSTISLFSAFSAIPGNMPAFICQNNIPFPKAWNFIIDPIVGTCSLSIGLVMGLITGFFSPFTIYQKLLQPLLTYTQNKERDIKKDTAYQIYLASHAWAAFEIAKRAALLILSISIFFEGKDVDSLYGFLGLWSNYTFCLCMGMLGCFEILFQFTNKTIALFIKHEFKQDIFALEYSPFLITHLRSNHFDPALNSLSETLPHLPTQTRNHMVAIVNNVLQDPCIRQVIDDLFTHEEKGDLAKLQLLEDPVSQELVTLISEHQNTLGKFTFLTPFRAILPQTPPHNPAM